MRINARTLLMLSLMLLLASMLIVVAGNGVSFYVRGNSILVYNATFYAVVHGVRGKPVEANVSAIILGLYSNYSEIQEFKYVHIIGANNTSRTLEYRDRVRIFYPSNNSMIVGPGVIPYVLSKNIIDALWSGDLGGVNISFWNLTNTSIELGSSTINTSIGLCKCIIIRGVYRKEFLLHNVSATLCYDRYGLLGYANISTGYLEPKNMRGNTRVIVYNVVNASIRLNKKLVESTTTSTSSATTSSGETGGFNCTVVYLPIILFIIGFGLWFRYKYLRK